MIQLLEGLGDHYAPRHYVLASSDKMSEEKIQQFEVARAKKGSTEQVWWYSARLDNALLLMHFLVDTSSNHSMPDV